MSAPAAPHSAIPWRVLTQIGLIHSALAGLLFIGFMMAQLRFFGEQPTFTDDIAGVLAVLALFMLLPMATSWFTQRRFRDTCVPSLGLRTFALLATFTGIWLRYAPFALLAPSVWSWQKAGILVLMAFAPAAPLVAAWLWGTRRWGWALAAPLMLAGITVLLWIVSNL